MKLAADDILQIAIEMEKHGRAFYEALSLGCGHEDIAALATYLAKSEKEHVQTFQRLRNSLPAHQRRPDLTEAELVAATDELRKKLLPDVRKVHKAVQTTDLVKTLNMAIEMETEAVAFYSDLASNIYSQEIAILIKIAEEEKEHLNMLQKVRELLSA